MIADLPRNSKIWLLWAEGYPLHTIGEWVGISHARVGQIVHKIEDRFRRVRRPLSFRWIPCHVCRAAGGRWVYGKTYPPEG
jgi:hypothetical protein